MKLLVRTLFIYIFLLLLGCQDDEGSTGIQETPSFVFLGGETTIMDATSNAFATPAPNLSPPNFDLHLAGDLAFEQTFVTAPAAVNPGLGPIFNNLSCVACHVRNGRSTGSLTSDELSGFLLRLSIPGQNEVGGPKPAPMYGTQLQTRAIFGVEPEGGFLANVTEQSVTLAGGEVVTLQKPNYSIIDGLYPVPEDIRISPRTAPAVFGLGLLEAIPDDYLMSIQDENDADGDGISGRVNIVWDAQKQTMAIGRFGWKAENPTAIQQTADAYHQDMGVTNPIFLEESCIDQPDCQDDGMADVNDETVETTAFYFQSLAVPAMRQYENKRVLRGMELFEQANCSSCHRSGQVTGTAVIPELENQTIYPYTDLLLHDMGEGLADNRPAFLANGREWRTAPLWGIGLFDVVNGHTKYLHDGRARNLQEAILWHGGEAEDAKNAFANMPPEDRSDLLHFLKSL